MFVNLAAGALSFPTTTSPTVNLAGRVALLRAAVMRLKQYRDERIVASPSTRWDGAGGRPSLVLVAPEYMFVREGFQLAAARDLKRNRFLEKSDKDAVVAELQRISAEFGKQLVLVPGSIASREALPAPGADRDERVQRAAQHIMTAALSMESFFPGRTEEELMEVATAGKLAGRTAMTPLDKFKKLSSALNTQKSTYYLADNVAYLLTNGKIVARYAKKGDFHERLPGASARTIYVPGIAAGRVTVGGINFGVEICLDHGLGALKNTQTVTGDLPRVHLLCSAEVNPQTANFTVREGGYFVHASSNLGYTVIQRKRGANLEAPGDAADATVSGHTMRMGVIELDI